MEMELLHAHDREQRVKDAELPCSDAADHHAARRQAHQAQLHRALLRGDSAHAHEHAPLAALAGLVDLREQGVRRVRDNRRSDASDHTRSQRNAKLRALGAITIRISQLVDALLCEVLHHELGDGVRDLLEEHGNETRVHSGDKTLRLYHGSRRSRHRHLRIDGVRHLTDPRGLEGAQEDVSDELRTGGGNRVEHEALVPCSLVAVRLREVHLEELEATELPPSLEEIAAGCGAKACRQRASSLVLDDLLEAVDHALVVLHRVELHARLNDVDGACPTVGDGAAETTSKRTFEVI
mmetsp:Transcript_130026/g.324074  ORF Transcript_130026/g.324074 Transcript_130026/m.324074 type:complete len:295 (+) Transcript_130026:222-1106(+)